MGWISIRALGCVCLALVTHVSVACSAAQTARVGVEAAPEQADSALRGAWIIAPAEGHRAEACPWIIEFFDEQTVETNFLNDDRGKLCMFARLPYKLDAERDPPMFEIGGQLGRCIFVREGERLKLACEDHGDPDPASDYWIEMQRLDTKEGGGQQRLAGTWLPPAFWGGGQPWQIDEKGALEAGPDSGSLDVVGENRLLLHLGKVRQRCLYRVSEHRLALRCTGGAAPWPERLGPGTSLADPEGTLVLYRLGPPPR